MRTFRLMAALMWFGISSGSPDHKPCKVNLFSRRRESIYAQCWYTIREQHHPSLTGETRFVAFDEDSQGGWAAAPGTAIPLDIEGGYASTWGEFDFGSSVNHGWSGFDVSAIQAQNAGLTIQGMQICDVLNQVCSAITRDASHVQNAYTMEVANVGGIGGNIAPGPVRLEVTLDYMK